MLTNQRTVRIMLIGVFTVCLLGLALISAKEPSPDRGSKERQELLPTLQNSLPRVTFRKIIEKEALEWASMIQAEEMGLKLLSGDYKIYPLDKETVFFFGELRTPMASIRSFLLRSGDGGRNWRDTMSPVYGSEVRNMDFIDARSGWALTLWTTEGAGEVRLYGSVDGGRSWRKVAVIPKRDHAGMPVALRFLDRYQGEIEMLYEHEIAVLGTKNGGRTWIETRTISLDEYEKRETSDSTQEILQAKDGSQWRLQENDGRVQVLRRIGSKDPWKELCAIPMSYKYLKGQVLLHQE